MKRCKTLLIWTLVVGYVVGGFVTNAYCRTHRWGDWIYQETRYNWKSEEYEEYDSTAGSWCKTTLATVFWPFYAMAKGSTWLVEEAPRLRVTVDVPG